MSNGYSAGAIRKTAEFVLTPFRKGKLESRPLKLAEFIGPLSQCNVTDAEAYDEVKAMTDKAAPFTNDLKRRKDIEALLRGDDDGGGGAKDKKKKKK